MSGVPTPGSAARTVRAQATGTRTVDARTAGVGPAGVGAAGVRPVGVGPAGVGTRGVWAGGVRLAGLACWSTLACLALLATSGCEVDQHVDVRLSGSGSAEIRVELHRLFVDYLLTLAEVSGDASLEPGTVFDLEQVEQAVSKRAGVHLEWIDSPAPERLELRLVFDDLAAVLGASTAAATAAGDIPLISLTGDSPRTLRVHIASDNYHQLTTLFPALENPLLIGLGPQPDLEVTDEEYLEMIAFVLGEQGPQAVLDSNVTVAVRVDGRVIEQEGGELLDDGSVLITIPLLRILVLDQPLAYTIVFE